MKRLWNSFQIAFSMYSRLPAVQCDWSEENMKYVMCFFPWIGAVIGALCFGWDCLSAYLNAPDALRNVVLMLIPAAVSGGIHLDGLLDVADAMSSWRPREKRLEILKDSNSGAFAVITCVVYFFLLYAVLDTVRGEMTAVYAFAFVISRSLSAISVVSFPKASGNGTVAGFARKAQDQVIRVCCGIYLILCAGIMAWIRPVYAAAALAAALLTFFWYYRMAMKNFGGINGDLAGCFVSVCELTVPAAVAAAGLLVNLIR